MTGFGLSDHHQANFKLKILQCYSFEMLKCALHSYKLWDPIHNMIYNLTDKVSLQVSWPQGLKIILSMGSGNPEVQSYPMPRGWVRG